MDTFEEHPVFLYFLLTDWTLPKDDDFLMEMLEVLINTIIYVRNVYPPAIFKRQKMYNTSCYICIYPPLRDYIQNAILTAATLKRQNELHKIDVVFEKDETTVLEVFSFRFVSNANEKTLFDDVSNDQYLIEAEESIRGILLSLDEKCKNLKDLPSDGVNFKIMLHTTQVALVKLTSDPKSQVCSYNVFRGTLFYADLMDIIEQIIIDKIRSSSIWTSVPPSDVAFDVHRSRLGTFFSIRSDLRSKVEFPCILSSGDENIEHSHKRDFLVDELVFKYFGIFRHSE